jgi:hypothetical protein
MSGAAFNNESAYFYFMKKQISTLLFVLLACSIIISFKQDNDFFEGKMISTNTFTDLEGNNIGKQLEPYLGKQVYYYINSKNYKGYNENQQLLYLYNSASKTYQNFDLMKKNVTKYDVTIKSTTGAEVVKLPNHETVAGYDFEIIQIKKDRSITTYFYSPKIKVDYKNFMNHEFGE